VQLEFLDFIGLTAIELRKKIDNVNILGETFLANEGRQ
jgi:hypothetical protein